MGRPVCRGLRPVSHEERILVAEGSGDRRLSPGSNTPLWPLLVLDGRLNLARFNQSACRAEPRTFGTIAC